MEDLQLGDALIAEMLFLLEPGLLEEEGEVVLPGLRHPAVAFPEEAHEERARTVDIGEADGEDLALLGLLLGDAPAQVDIDELDLALAAAAAKLGEDRFHQQIALPRKVSEGRGEEDADGAGVRGGHGGDFWGLRVFLETRNPLADRREILVGEGLGLLFGMFGEVFAEEAPGFLVIPFEALVAGEVVGDGVAGLGGEHGEASEEGNSFGPAVSGVECARQAVGGGICVRMFQSKGFFAALQGAAVERLGPVVIAFVFQ